MERQLKPSIIVFAALILCAFYCDLLFASKAQTVFVQAETALKKKQFKKSHQLQKQLQNYPLLPYLINLEYQYKIAQLPYSKIEQFENQYPDFPLNQELKRQWLVNRAKHKHWNEYLKAYDDQTATALRCYYVLAQHKTGNKSALTQTKSLWLVGRSQPKACNPLFHAWEKAGYLTKDLRWQRIGLSMDSGRTSLARHLAKKLPKADRKIVDKWIVIRRRPQAVLTTTLAKSKHPQAKTIIAYGIKRLAKRDPDKAIKAWNKHNKKFTFNQIERYEIFKEIGLGLAYKKHKHADQWLAKVKHPTNNEMVQEWQIRSALLNNDWQQVSERIEQLPTNYQQKERWQYWKARSFEQLGQRDLANEIYLKLSGERDFYGFLASDILNKAYSLNHAAVKLTKAERKQVENVPAIARAKELYKLKRYAQARTEWRHIIKSLSDQQLIAAAHIADSWGWHNMAIITLGKSSYRDDLNIRFPIKHKKTILKEAKRQTLSPAVILAITRQESAFAHNARSSAGAVGLMQLMPRTARQVARSTKTRYRSKHDLLKTDLNIKLGSSYLRELLDSLDNNLTLATAAYNAGPHRVKKWLPKEDMSADIWVETIPFNETRNYLKNVLAFLVIYHDKLGIKTSILDHMPVVKTSYSKLK